MNSFDVKILVGHCTECGNPIFSIFTWNGVTFPPCIPTCSCFPSKDIYIKHEDYEIEYPKYDYSVSYRY